MSSNDGNVQREEPNSIEEFLVGLDETIDRQCKDIADITRRLTAVEEGMAGQSLCLDRVISRLEVIEQRLGARVEDGMPTASGTPR